MWMFCCCCTVRPWNCQQLCDDDSCDAINQLKVIMIEGVRIWFTINCLLGRFLSLFSALWMWLRPLRVLLCHSFVLNLMWILILPSSIPKRSTICDIWCFFSFFFHFSHTKQANWCWLAQFFFLLFASFSRRWSGRVYFSSDTIDTLNTSYRWREKNSVMRLHRHNSAWSWFQCNGSVCVYMSHSGNVFVK